MRIPSQTDYDRAKAALAAYAEFCKPYVQKNGWTVIPADALRPSFEGVELTTDKVNAFSTDVELFELDRDKPEKLSAYVAAPHDRVTTWTGEQIGLVCYAGSWHRNNMGARWRSLRVRSAWGAIYHGREYDSRDLVNLRRSRA